MQAYFQNVSCCDGMLRLAVLFLILNYNRKKKKEEEDNIDRFLKAPALLILALFPRRYLAKVVDKPVAF
jgi:hypothetical protein